MTRKETGVKSLLFWILIVVVVVVLWRSISASDVRDREISFNEFTTLVEAGDVQRIMIRERRVIGELRSPRDGSLEIRLVLPFEPDAEYAAGLLAAGVILYGSQPEEDPLLALLFTWGPILVIIGLWIYFMRRFSKAGNERLAEARSGTDGRSP
jgi:cell division protease FtsH